MLSTTDGQPDAADRQRVRSVLSGLLAYRHPSGQDSPNSCSSAFHLQKNRIERMLWDRFNKPKQRIEILRQ